MLPHVFLPAHIRNILLKSWEDEKSPSILGMLSDISHVDESSDWWFILFGILFVDVVIILAARHFPTIFGRNLNIWYDSFGLSAVLADVMIIAIGFLIARTVYTKFFVPYLGWSPLHFVGLLVAIQAIHDLLFYVLVIKPFPRGLNEMMDVFQDYSKGGAKIIAGDAGLMIGSAIVAMWLKDLHPETFAAFAIGTAYVLPYTLFTNPKI